MRDHLAAVGTSSPVILKNPHIRFINRNRSYVRNVVTASEWTAGFRVVDQVTSAGAQVAVDLGSRAGVLEVDRDR